MIQRLKTPALCAAMMGLSMLYTEYRVHETKEAVKESTKEVTKKLRDEMDRSHEFALDSISRLRSFNDEQNARIWNFLVAASGRR